jgi:AraC family transcriptional regulator
MPNTSPGDSSREDALARRPVTGGFEAAWDGLEMRLYDHFPDRVEAPPIARHEIVLVLGGTGIVRRRTEGVGWEAFVVRPGYMALTPAGMSQTLLKQTRSRAVHLYLESLPPARLDGALERAEIRLLPRFGVPDPFVNGVVHTLLGEARAAGFCGRLFVEQLETTLWLHLARAHASRLPPMPAGRAPLAAWQLRRLRERMLEDLAADLSLADLAALVGLSTHHLCRAFRARTGMPPYRYFLSLRIERARQLLEAGGANVTEVAQAVGYDDPNQFTRVFRRLTGMTPRDFRRRP